MKSDKALSMYLAWLLLLWGGTIQAAADKPTFEKERKQLLQRIKTIKHVLAQTVTQKKVSLGQLAAINAQIASNERLIQSINGVVQDIKQQIQQKQCAIAILEKELIQLKREYGVMIYLGTKAMNDINTLVFIFSAHSFHELVHRLRYVKQYAKIRQKHLHTITTAMASLQVQKTASEQKRKQKKVLLQSKQEEQAKLADLKYQQKQLISTFEQQHTKLYQELKQRNTAVKRLDKLLNDIIQQAQVVQKAEQKIAHKTPPQRIAKPKGQVLTNNFNQNRGKLPWPVKKGFISSKFGIFPHAVLRNVMVENLGIDIQTQQGATVHVVFEGIVKTVALVPGMNKVVIIQHGHYHTVYAKLKHTVVKVGQHLKAQAPIGVVDTDPNGTTELQLQLWKGTQRLNPACWLAAQ